jgi:hypothetical protein
MSEPLFSAMRKRGAGERLSDAGVSKRRHPIADLHMQKS